MQEYVLRKFPSCSSLCSICKHDSEERRYCRRCASGHLSRNNRLLRHESSLELYNILQGKNSACVDVRQESYYPLSPFPYDGFQHFLTYTATNKAFKNKACLCKPIIDTPKENMKNKLPSATYTAPMPVPTHPKKERKKVCPLFRRKKKLDRHDTGTNVSGYGGRSATGGGEGAEDGANREIRIILCGGTCSSTATNTVATQSSTLVAANSNGLKIQNTSSKTNTCAPECDILYQTPAVSREDFSGGPNASVSLKSQRDMRDQTNQVPVRQAKPKTCKCADKSEQASLVNNVSRNTSSKGAFGRKQSASVGTAPKCNCQEHVETLRMLIKMEAKQNYRLISNIMKELSYQRDEMRRMTDLYEDVVLNVGISNSKRKDIFGSDICTAESKCTKCRKCRAKETSKDMKDILNHSMKSDSMELSRTPEKKKTGCLSLFNMYSQEYTEEIISDDKSVKNSSKAVFCVQDVVTNQQSSKELKETGEGDCVCPAIESKSINCVLNDFEADPEEDKETFSSSCPVLRKVLDFLNFKRRSSTKTVD
nr:unnamed protein product [Callosobruchus analis]